MSEFAKNLLPRVKLTLREASSDFDEEIISYIETCAKDLRNAGILGSFFELDSPQVDPQILQAIRWYCLSVYGLYNSDMDKYAKAYGSLKATLATQRDYTQGTISFDSGNAELGFAKLGKLILGKEYKQSEICSSKF